MDNPNTVSALTRKRAELAGRIEATQATLRQLIIDLDYLDHTIRIFAPDIDLEQIKPKPLPPRHQAFQGQMTRLLLSAIRQSDRPLTLAELTRHVMAERGLNSADTRLMLTMSKRVGSALRNLRHRGTVRSEMGPNDRLVWLILG
jgi:hypothetical protein